MVEARELLGVYVCVACKELAGHCIDVPISWKGYYYGCSHVAVIDLQESGYLK